MVFSDLALSQRLERAEGFACAQYAQARRQMDALSGAEWMELAGGFVVFDGVDSPCTQTFGLGLTEELTTPTLDRAEAFFLDRGAAVMHELSPFAGVGAQDLLCSRGYKPFELSSVLYRTVSEPESGRRDGLSVRVTGPDEAGLWAKISAEGWAHDHPELMQVLLQLGAVSAAREGSVCFLAEADGEQGAAGVLCLHERVALFGGSSTIPELRRRGLQSALLAERMAFAHRAGCDLAMMVALPGSESQRNAERIGFQIAYTRTKWQLCA